MHIFIAFISYTNMYDMYLRLELLKVTDYGIQNQVKESVIYIMFTDKSYNVWCINKSNFIIHFIELIGREFTEVPKRDEKYLNKIIYRHMYFIKGYKHFNRF